MKPIEKEAEVSANNLYNKLLVKAVEKDFIADANSKTVDGMILKAVELARNNIDWSCQEHLITEQEILEKIKKQFL